jgi:hypothetical protein
MIQKSITTKIDALSKEFQSILEVDLWKNFPIDQLGNINGSVTNRDEFISKILSLVAIFDSFNKKEFDKKTGIKTNGTRASFITLLKTEFINNQPEIQNEIENPIGIICLLRDYIAHGKNKNYKKAFEYFEVKHPVEDWKILWESVLLRFGLIFDATLLLFKNRNTNILKSSEINLDLQEILKEEIFQEVLRDVENDQTKAILREIACRDEIIDRELASIFNINVKNIRTLLFPFLRNVLIVRPYDEESTILQMVDFMRDNIKSM